VAVKAAREKDSTDGSKAGESALRILKITVDSIISQKRIGQFNFWILDRQYQQKLLNISSAIDLFFSKKLFENSDQYEYHLGDLISLIHFNLKEITEDAGLSQEPLNSFIILMKESLSMDPLVRQKSFENLKLLKTTFTNRYCSTLYL
jgi:hypothetical protein